MNLAKKVGSPTFFQAVNVKQIAQHISQIPHKCQVHAQDDQHLGKIEITSRPWNLKTLRSVHL